MAESIKFKVEVLSRGFIVSKDGDRFGCSHVSVLGSEIETALKAFQSRLVPGDRFTVEIHK